MYEKAEREHIHTLKISEETMGTICWYIFGPVFESGPISDQFMRGPELGHLMLAIGRSPNYVVRVKLTIVTGIVAIRRITALIKRGNRVRSVGPRY